MKYRNSRCYTTHIPTTTISSRSDISEMLDHQSQAHSTHQERFRKWLKKALRLNRGPKQYICFSPMQPITEAPWTGRVSCSALNEYCCCGVRYQSTDYVMFSHRESDSMWMEGIKTEGATKEAVKSSSWC